MIIQNAILNLETGEIIKSAHVHDFVTTIFKDGHSISVDGGTDYLKRAGDLNGKDIKWRELSIDERSGFEVIKNMLVWGTYGKSGKEKLSYKLIKNLTLSHLKAILKTQSNISPIHLRVIKYWITKKTKKK